MIYRFLFVECKTVFVEPRNSFDKGVKVELFSVFAKNQKFCLQSVQFTLDCLHKTNLLLCFITFCALGIKYIYSVLCWLFSEMVSVTATFMVVLVSCCKMQTFITSFPLPNHIPSFSIPRHWLSQDFFKIRLFQGRLMTGSMAVQSFSCYKQQHQLTSKQCGMAFRLILFN